MKCPKCRADNPETQRFCGECGTFLLPPERAAASFTKTLETPVDELISGALFAGRYQIIEELGKGGMGTVFRALDKTLNEEVALKLIKPEIGPDKGTLERFHNELKLARKISHRHVGRMYELLEDRGKFFITMEYVPGEDLKSLIKRVRQLAPGTVLAIARQVGEGLAEAHRLGIVHRDLKPSNIMIDKEGDAKIMDFGIARRLAGRGITGEGMVIGTPEYMSPEQVDGQEADRRSDIYSLGIILYEMLTGHAPFEGEAPLSVALKHKSAIPADPRKLNPQIPAELSDLILKCLQKDRQQRFQTADELLAELSRIEGVMPTAERAIPVRKPLTSKEITVKFGVKKAVISAAVVIVALTLAFVMWQMLRGGRPSPIPSGSPSLAVMYFKNNTGDERLDHLRIMLADLIINDLTQSKYIEVLSGERLSQILNELNQQDARSYSAGVLKRVAVRGKVNHILTGDYAKAGDLIRIHVALLDARTEKTLASESAEGKGEESLFAMVDGLTRKIKVDLNLSPAELSRDIDKEIGEITTKNTEAYKYYAEGMRFKDRGEPRQGIPLLEKAVSLDPEFALAYREIAMCYQNLGLEKQYKEYLRKAMEFKDRLSERERYLIAGSYYYISERTYDQAIENFKKLLDLYPQSYSAAHNLANVYFDLEDWDKAIEYYRLCLRDKSPFIWSYEYLACVYRAKGLAENAYDVLQEYLKNNADDVFFHSFLAHHYICQGKYDLAGSELDKVLTINPTHIYNAFLRGANALYQDQWDIAEREFTQILQADLPEGWYRGRYGMVALSLYQGKIGQAIGHVARAIEQTKSLNIQWAESEYHSLLSRAYLISGKPEEALKEGEVSYRTAVESDRLPLQRIALHYMGLAYLARKFLPDALKTAGELKALIDNGFNKKEIRRYEHLLGMIELEQGNAEAAVGHFERAVADLPLQDSLWTENLLFFNAYYLEPLARAHLEAGHLEKAREVYEKITALTVGRFLYGDIYTRSFYRLGIIAEQQGQKAEALKNYQKFLSLWKDADPIFPEVADAKKRLSGLQSQ